jgi:hypothetical protein
MELGCDHGPDVTRNADYLHTHFNPDNGIRR